MAAESRPGQTVMDYITIVLSPVLIMGLVGSLVFFLLEVLYRADGPWKERLQWILFFFVFGSVLTARISMMGEIASRSKLYGIALALATYLGMQAYVEMPVTIRPISFVVNLFLILLVWWCVHRLVWDCTNVDETADMNAAGLLQVSGLESKVTAPGEEEVIEAEVDEPAGRVKLSGFDLWWQRYRRYREKQTKKRSLGVWVVYFSLAALPIFGLGQAFLPLTAPDRRAFCFWLMTIYVGCGLGLLLTTCFLGLRRYLRQKNLQMPAAMTRAWLTMGGLLILAILVIAAILPRPYSETSLLDLLDRAGSAKRQANQMALKGDSPGEGEGQKGPNRTDPKAKGDKTADKGQNPRNKDKDGKAGKDGSDKEKSKDRDSGKAKATKGTPEKAKPGEAKNKGEANTPSQQQSPNRLAQILQKVGPWLKWLVFAVLAVIVVGALLRGGLGFLANFTDWARRLLEAWRKFWNGLFGEKKAERLGEVGKQDETIAPEPTIPFSAFANPFDSGKADRMDPPDLVRYTFQALEAWARDRDLGREPDETAQEFIARLGDELPTLEQEATRLGELHARVEYGRGTLPGGAVETVRRFWDRLERVTEAPLSA